MNRRKKQFVRFDVQLKVVLIALFVASFVLLIHFQLALSSFLSLSDRLSAATSIAAALEILRQELIRRFFLAFAIAIPLAVSVGVIYSFKFSGPVYRFKRYFTDLAGGRWDAPLALRKTDDLQDVCTAINAGLAPLRDRLRAHREVFRELEGFFAEAGFTADGNALERMRRLRERIASEEKALAERFPEAKEPSAAPAPAAAAEPETAAAGAAS